MKEIKHLELFAGIGGFRMAIDLIAKKFSIHSKCVGFSEIDKYAVTTYKSNFIYHGEAELGDIASFVTNKSEVKKLKEFDLLTGGFPCQSFSMMGAQGGFNDMRGNLFFSIIELIKNKRPKYFLLENVRNIKTHDNGRTYKKILESLDEAGYDVFADVFNTSNFGLPQHRRRVYFFGVRKDISKKTGKIVFNHEVVKERYDKNYKKFNINKYENTLEVLDKEVPDKYYLSEKIKPTILSNGSKKFESNSVINQLVARPLTATMVKLHRACQDNYYSWEFLNSENYKKYLEKDFTKKEECLHRIRKLTPREAFELQGFNKTFYNNAIKGGISEHQLYKQAGNAVSVNTVYSILHYLLSFKYIKI